MEEVFCGYIQEVGALTGSVSAHPELPPLIAISETLGVTCPPRAVVAAEILPMLAPDARRIAWVYRPPDELFAEQTADGE
jgi:hypothetical protein